MSHSDPAHSAHVSSTLEFCAQIRTNLHGLAFAFSGSQRRQRAEPKDGRLFVIWFYAKEGRHLRCEVRQMVNGERFDLIITEADGSERVEHFDSSVALTKRSVQLETEWRNRGWEGPFGREY